ncbi:hypothetical protein ABID95_006285 [Streptomyces atratus]
MFGNRLRFRSTLRNLNGRKMNSPCQHGKLLASVRFGASGRPNLSLRHCGKGRP